ncbi:MAG TPA: hypothetical protein VE818_01660 [Nitrososphaeraceae archaeon]|jgi:hypothetical protein|nr:hypothetical protein [Nitrososphaeraceae archaeon]
MFASDADSERASSIEDYQNTCSEFISDISRDYKDWVDRYQLSQEENTTRKASIDNIVRTTNEWIVKYGNTIKKVDIIMNDGVSKMAENTAGYPFKFEVAVNNMMRYTSHPIGKVKVNIKAIPREGKLIRVGNYRRDQLLLINSISTLNFSISNESLKCADILDDYVVIDASECKKYDLISITIVIEEIKGEYATESRGYSTIILLT